MSAGQTTVDWHSLRDEMPPFGQPIVVREVDAAREVTEQIRSEFGVRKLLDWGYSEWRLP